MGEGSWEVAADREPSRKRILPPEYVLGDINSPNVKMVTKATALSMCESPVKDEFRICQRAVVYSGAVAGVSCFKLVNPVAIAFCEAVIGN